MLWSVKFFILLLPYKDNDESLTLSLPGHALYQNNKCTLSTRTTKAALSFLRLSRQRQQELRNIFLLDFFGRATRIRTFFFLGFSVRRTKIEPSLMCVSLWRQRIAHSCFFRAVYEVSLHSEGTDNVYGQSFIAFLCLKTQVQFIWYRRVSLWLVNYSGSRTSIIAGNNASLHNVKREF